MENICKHCGNIIPLEKCDECGMLVLITKLTTVIDVDKTKQKLCDFCENVSYGKHTYEHNKKVFDIKNEYEKLEHIKNNPTFAYLYIKELLA